MKAYKIISNSSSLPPFYRSTLKEVVSAIYVTDNYDFIVDGGQRILNGTEILNYLQANVDSQHFTSITVKSKDETDEWVAYYKRTFPNDTLRPLIYGIIETELN